MVGFSLPMHPLLSDPWVARRIDAALAPYQGTLSPEDLAFMREQLAELLATNEHAARLLHRAKPRPASAHVDESGEAVIGPLEPPEQAPSAAPRRRAGGDV